MVRGLQKVKFEDIEVGVVVNHRTDLGSIDSLQESILHYGLLQPLVTIYKHAGGNGFVRPDTGKKVFSRYILVSGHRRYEAIKRIRASVPPDGNGIQPFDEIPVVLYQGNETDAKICQLAENIERKDLNHVELADAYVDLINCGMTQGEIAKRVRCSQKSVNQLVNIRRRCCDRVLRALAAGEIPLETAEDISRIEGSDAQCRQLDKFLGTKIEKGKSEAKRETKKDTGGRAKGSIKEASRVIPLVLTVARKDGLSDAARDRWFGAQAIVDYLTGADEGDGIMQEAEKILARAKEEAKKNVDVGAQTELVS